MGYWQRELIRAHMKRKCNGKASSSRRFAIRATWFLRGVLSYRSLSISFFRSVTGGYDPGAEDLTVAGAKANNETLGSPPLETIADGVSNTVKYSFVAADADANHNGFIDHADQRGDEGFPFGKSWVNLFGLGIGRTTIANGQYQFLKNNFHVKWRPGHRPQYLTDGSPFKNDSAVQVPSMAYPKFANLVTNSDGFLPFNHRDEMEPFTAQIVLGAIKDAQHIQ
jgi:hypothetical protein